MKTPVEFDQVLSEVSSAVKMVDLLRKKIGTEEKQREQLNKIKNSLNLFRTCLSPDENPLRELYIKNSGKISQANDLYFELQPQLIPDEKELPESLLKPVLLVKIPNARTLSEARNEIKTPHARGFWENISFDIHSGDKPETFVITGDLIGVCRLLSQCGISDVPKITLLSLKPKKEITPPSSPSLSPTNTAA